MATKEECVQAVMQAAGVERKDAEDALKQAKEERDRLKALGVTQNVDAQLGTWAQRTGEEAKIAAALQRKQVALNVLKREGLEVHLSEFLAGLRGKPKEYREAFLSMLVGSYARTAHARDSVAAGRLSIVRTWLGGMMREIGQIPAVDKLLRKDKGFVDDVVREMYQIHDQGKPGITGNAKARQVAEIFARYAEGARIRLNDAGAFIRKLPGWVPQSHDERKLLKAGRDKWMRDIMGLLDHERTFPGKTPDEIKGILHDVYETIVTGRERGVTAAEKGEYLSPRNLARSLEHHRVLHFQDADAWLKYQADYSSGNLVTNMINHLDMSARKLSLMEKLGPNPETMFTALLERERRRIRESDMDPKKMQQALDALKGDISKRKGPIGRAFAEVMGETLMPDNPKWAKISAGIRAIQSMAKLGGAVISSMADLMTYAMNARYNGINLFQAYGNAFQALIQGRGTREVHEIAQLLGTLYDGMLHEVASRWHAQDSLNGKMADLMGTFFKWSGLNYWTDALKSGYSRMLSTHLADRLMTVGTWERLDPGLRQGLEAAGFGERHYESLRNMVRRAEDGRHYTFAEQARSIPDHVLDDLNHDRIQDISRQLKVGESKDPILNLERQQLLDERVQRMRELTRQDLEKRYMAWITDQTHYAVIEPDDRTRATMVRGTQPGSVLGEIARFVTQFKSFPIAYYQRNLSAAGRYRIPGGGVGSDAAGIAHMIVGSLVLGYAAGMAKDLVKLRTPKDPMKWETWLAAAVQSGGAGIYGDFLFAKYNRFGGSPIDTLAGPTAGVGSELLTFPSQMIRGNMDWGDFARLGMDNAPFLNLWYTRAALDWMILYHVREMISPGTLQRTEKRFKEEYNQVPILSPAQNIKRGGGFR
jgi:hypothetical protein